jgi:hypothetical protein
MPPIRIGRHRQHLARWELHFQARFVPWRQQREKARVLMKTDPLATYREKKLTTPLPHIHVPLFLKYVLLMP